MLTAISPIDGRYAGKTKILSDYFSEFAFIRYRVIVEIEYFKALCSIPLTPLADVNQKTLKQLQSIVDDLDPSRAEQIKEIEKTTNHDVKAVEYYLKEQFDHLGLSKFREFIHFGLTSQDINNTAFPMMIRDALKNAIIPECVKVRTVLKEFAEEWRDVPMLARTHGQPASPTLLGKEMMVYVERLDEQISQLKEVPIKVKFGGATGNLNAHYVAYPDINWHYFASEFTLNKLGLERGRFTTQIEHYDNLAAIFHACCRINTILLDLCRDFWSYISMDYFKQKIRKGEVGSSAMPHKVNPIDFENAEGNIGLANAIFQHLAEKLPVSRLQRDLSDSTALRNVGVPFGHTLIALQSILKGLSKLILNENKLNQDLDDNWMVLAEAIQTILRREGYDKPYESLLDLTRGADKVDRDILHAFIDTLDINPSVKQELKMLAPHNYTGRF